MIRRIAFGSIAFLLAGGVALADFSYEQTSKITGGAMMNMVRVMGAFSKQLREPMRSTFAVKGDRMAVITQQGTQVIDLASETITEINPDRKQYSVTSFADWSAALSAMDSEIKAGDSEYRDVTVTAKVDQPGDTRVVNGTQTKHAILTVVFEGTDKKGQKATFMTMVSDMWLAPDVPGYSEIQSFYQRMAAKLNWSPSSGFLSSMAPGSSKGMAAMMQEMSKLQGVPVLTYTSMVFGTPEQAAEIAKKQREQPQQQEQKAEERPSAGRALGRLGGRLGGFGGLGRSRQQEPEPEAAGGEQGGAATGSFMEMTTEAGGFSQAAVDPAKFEVPAGYKKVDSPTVKAMKRR
ncbi:MAG: hypothetical protein ACM3ZB_14830 [bacterium]|jgi:hypothetical protein